MYSNLISKCKKEKNPNYLQESSKWDNYLLYCIGCAVCDEKYLLDCTKMQSENKPTNKIIIEAPMIRNIIDNYFESNIDNETYTVE